MKAGSAGQRSGSPLSGPFAFSPFRAFAFSFVRSRVGVLLLAGVPLLTGCTRDGRFAPVSMWNESRLRPLAESPMPGEQSSSRPLPAGTIARGEIPANDPMNSGRSGTQLLTAPPMPITPALLARGQDRFNIYCSPCHSRVGNGEGMIVERGFPHPPDYKISRLRSAPIGHFVDVMTHGYGVMYSYASRVPPEDRWAIASYIRVLQAVNRPVIPESRYLAQRVRARATGIGTKPVSGGT
jgi:mono/diheme cytochrome c family protein